MSEVNQCFVDDCCLKATPVISARVVKILKGGWYSTTFHPDVRMDGHYSCEGMVYAKMFYGGMVLFSGGPRIPPQIEYCQYLANREA